MLLILLDAQDHLRYQAKHFRHLLQSVYLCFRKLYNFQVVLWEQGNELICLS